MSLNGAAARKVDVGDTLIICAYALYHEKELEHNFYQSVHTVALRRSYGMHFASWLRLQRMGRKRQPARVTSMESTKIILDKLAAQNIRLWSEAGNLRFRAPQGAMSQELLADLQSHKAELLRLFEGREGAAQPITTFHLRPMPRTSLVPWFFKQALFIDDAARTMTLSMANAVHLVVRIAGPLSTDLIALSVQRLLDRHELLHYNARFAANNLFLETTRRRHADVEHIELLEASASARELEALRRAAELTWKEMDLERDPLFRVFTICLAEKDYILGIVLHHLIADVFSLRIFAQEMFAIYQSMLSGSPAALRAPRLQYADYLLCVADYVASVSGAACLAYWVNALKGAPPTALVPDFRNPSNCLESRAQEVHIDAELSAALQGLVQRSGTTLFAVLVSAQLITIQHFTHQDDVTLFTVASMRDYVDLHSMLGAIADIEPCRCSLAGNPSFSDVLGRVTRWIIAATRHRPMPFDVVNEELGKVGTKLAAPVFNFTVDMETQELTAEQGARPGVQPLHFACPVPSQTRECFTHALYLTQRPSGVTGVLKYKPSVYREATVRRFLKHMEAVMRAAVVNSDAPIATLGVEGQINH